MDGWRRIQDFSFSCDFELSSVKNFWLKKENVLGLVFIQNLSLFLLQSVIFEDAAFTKENV